MEPKVLVYGKAKAWTALGIIDAYLKLNPAASVDDLNKAFPREKFASAKSIDKILVDMKELEKEINANGTDREKTDIANARRIHWYLTLEDGTDVIFYKIMWAESNFPVLIEWAKQYGIEVSSFEKTKGGTARGSYELEYLNGFTAPEANQKAPDTAQAEKAAQEKAAAEAAKAQAEKEAAAAKAELEALAKAQAEAEAAKAELARLQAEAAKAKAEAEAIKAKADADKAAAQATACSGDKTSKDGAQPGLFSVGSNKKVRFSMGNLQFNPKKYEFRFAEHQYDRIGKDNTKIAPNYDGWIDLFGYGTSGYMGCEPTETSKNSDQYPKVKIDGTNYDWGVYNPISNGGNKEGLWRTLTRDEWVFLFNKRANAAKLRAKACVNGINGAIILPDNFYERRVQVPFDSSPDNFNGNTYDLAQWATLEAAGAVFLPCCGCRFGTSMELSPIWVYWTSFANSDKNVFMADLFSFCYISHDGCCRGVAVRLVQDVK